MNPSKPVRWIAVCVIAGFAVALWFSQLAHEARATLPPNQPAPSATVPPEATALPAAATPYNDAAFHAAETGLSPGARAGREIWFKATAGNARFHTYTFQQRITALIDWYGVLRGDQRDTRFKTWGLINDPGCCTPGSADCPASSYEATYGFDWCPGDQTLLKFVGKPGYRDPACDFKDTAATPSDPAGHRNGREDSCNLAFGTSTGALGFRKFPNPRFDPVAWKKLNGSLGTWQGYDRKLSSDPARADFKLRKLADASIEPPFLIGTACASCHVAFDPAKPPPNPAHPKWENISGLVGNQYLRISELLISGMPHDDLLWQTFAHARPGTSDTSAIPNDQVNNAGTINALINIAQRPTFAGEQVKRWRKTAACPTGTQASSCWCEPGKPGKCWEKSLQAETVHHILKGGEDSIGALGAIQRVYFNIGSCAEQCWVNHLTDLRQLDPQARNFGQTPFDIGQCRRDCPNFRAVEDRLQNILDFFLTAPEGHARDLREARANQRQTPYAEADLERDLDHSFGNNAVSRGQQVFATNCARCHSSDKPPFEAVNFRALDSKTGLRADWLGNDVPTPVTEIGTDRCRALHSNHLRGHVWEQFADENYFARMTVSGILEPHDGGRGYYRNISLLNLWAHAPFLHNNSVGPELCGWGGDKANPYEQYRSSYVDTSRPGNPPLARDKQPACWQYDPSVEGRFKLYVASMNDLLNPPRRIPKALKLDQDIVLDIGPRIFDGQAEKRVVGFTVRVPTGASAGNVGNFRHKEFIGDLVRAKLEPAELDARLAKILPAQDAKQVAAEMRTIGKAIVSDPNRLVELVKAARVRTPALWQVYSSCNVEIENDGHRFGEDLSDADKNALIAFLATF
ncbi:cytochrome c [Sulfuriferula sp.]|uniref:cytochrome c n=1 Tax=Sulfuriferula sp. TaxID=2025307 RepID=UPI00272F7C2B|nr:cytochrome c [Sulfuriferula sp.]MDP2027340.1 cytochrome c [Sulfuriferula sp.]